MKFKFSSTPHCYTVMKQVTMTSGNRSAVHCYDVANCHYNFKLFDVLWSDPRSINGCQPNRLRGGGVYFGPDITEQFLHKNNFTLLVRSHECKQNGFDMTHDKKVLLYLCN